MGRGIAISPVNTRQINKVVARKRGRSSIQGDFRGLSKPEVIKSKKEKIRKMQLAAEKEYMMLQEKMYQNLFNEVEETTPSIGMNLNTAI